jgi:hypothetical protein
MHQDLPGKVVLSPSSPAGPAGRELAEHLNLGHADVAGELQGHLVGVFRQGGPDSLDLVAGRLPASAP